MPSTAPLTSTSCSYPTSEPCDLSKDRREDRDREEPTFHDVGRSADGRRVQEDSQSFQCVSVCASSLTRRRPRPLKTRSSGFIRTPAHVASQTQRGGTDAAPEGLDGQESILAFCITAAPLRAFPLQGLLINGVHLVYFPK